MSDFALVEQHTFVNFFQWAPDLIQNFNTPLKVNAIVRQLAASINITSSNPSNRSLYTVNSN